jgi:hypothetical protein
MGTLRFKLRTIPLYFALLLVWTFLTPSALSAADDEAVSMQEPRRRTALVIGNNAYAMESLKNSVNDARSMDQLLKKAGFDVQLALDQDAASMNQSIERFSESLLPGNIALFYFSGHGMEIDGVQYCNPTDCDAPDDVLYKHRAVSLNSVLKRMEHANTWLNILIVDACRTNAYKSISSAAPSLPVSDAGRGTVIIFSTAPNVAASDNANEENGLFTKYLLEALDRPCETLVGAFERASERTYEASLGAQLPWIAISRRGGDFYLFPPQSTQVAQEGGTGSIRISVDSPGAEVLLDGTTVAVLGEAGTYEVTGVPVGRRAVTVMKKFNQTSVYRQELEVTAGRATAVTANITLAPTADYILNKALDFIGGESAVKSINTLVGEGTIYVPYYRVRSKVKIFWKRPSRMRVEMTFGTLTLVQWTDGRNIWQAVGGQKAQPLGGEEAGNLLQMAALEGPYVDRWARGIDAQYSEDIEDKGKKLHHVVVTYADGRVSHYYYNADDFRLEYEVRMVKTGTGITQVTTVYEDHRVTSGIRLPHKATIVQRDLSTQAESIVAEITTESLVFNTNVADYLFAPPR